MNQNNYLGRGINDYLYAKNNLKDHTQAEYNWPVVILSQAAEKLLKAIVETKLVDDSSCIALMRTHNLRTITSKISEKFPSSHFSSKDCKWLGDFYFDARYPGDDFIQVTLDDALEALKIVEDILLETEKLLTSDEERLLFEYCKTQQHTII